MVVDAPVDPEGSGGGVLDGVALDEGAIDEGPVDEGPVNVPSAQGNIVCGKVARSRAAGSVGKYKLPLWPQADSNMVHTTTLAAATQPR